MAGSKLDIWANMIELLQPYHKPRCLPAKRKVPGSFLGPAFPVAVPRCLACLLLPTRTAMIRLPFLVCMLHPPLGLLPVLLLPCLLTVMMKFLFRVSHAVLHWFRVMVMLQFLSCAPAVLAALPPPPLLLFALDVPGRLAASADALSGMVNTHLLLLLSCSTMHAMLCFGEFTLEKTFKPRHNVFEPHKLLFCPSFPYRLPLCSPCPLGAEDLLSTIPLLMFHSL
jgi:hypothetical protein